VLISLDRLAPFAGPEQSREANGGSSLAALDPSRPIAVHCKSGYRSSIATSLLERAGFSHLFNVVGGFDAWQTQKLRGISGTATCRTAEAASKSAG